MIELARQRNANTMQQRARIMTRYTTQWFHTDTVSSASSACAQQLPQPHTRDSLARYNGARLHRYPLEQPAFRNEVSSVASSSAH